MKTLSLKQIIGTTPQETKLILETLDYDIEKYLNHKDKKFLYDVPFRTPYEVIRDKKAICLEAAMTFGYALDERFQPFLLHLTKINKPITNPSHCVLGYVQNNLFGSLGISPTESQNSKDPIFPTLRKLAESYLTEEIDYDCYNTKQISHLPKNWHILQASMGIMQFISEPHPNKAPAFHK